MGLSIVYVVIGILVIAIWLLFGFKRIKHKFFAIFLIALVLFSFLALMLYSGGKEISVNGLSDFGNLAKIYFSWLGNIFGNMKTITGQAIEMDWQGNKTT